MEKIKCIREWSRTNKWFYSPIVEKFAQLPILTFEQEVILQIIIDQYDIPCAYPSSEIVLTIIKSKRKRRRKRRLDEEIQK